jgi:peptidyl-prolyl cis-trans isomerase SurA
MRERKPIWNCRLRALEVCLAVAAVLPCAAQEKIQPVSNFVVLDRAVAVVNRHVILSSDIDDEIQLSFLEPNRRRQDEPNRSRVLERLISRNLIEQQIRREDMQAVMPTEEEVSARLDEIRKTLPDCGRQDCASAAGWKSFLAAHGITPERVEAYLRYRLEILRFIEMRFRQGIQITPQQIESYYRETLLPQYAATAFRDFAATAGECALRRLAQESAPARRRRGARSRARARRRRRADRA